MANHYKSVHSLSHIPQLIHHHCQMLKMFSLSYILKLPVDINRGHNSSCCIVLHKMNQQQQMICHILVVVPIHWGMFQLLLPVAQFQGTMGTLKIKGNITERNWAWIWNLKRAKLSNILSFFWLASDLSSSSIKTQTTVTGKNILLEKSGKKAENHGVTDDAGWRIICVRLELQHFNTDQLLYYLRHQGW